MKRLIFAVFFAVTTLAFSALALEVPSNPLGRVSDYTNTLNTSEISQLEQVLKQYEQDTTNQIAVVLIPTLEGDNLEDYSIRLAEKWKIGQEGKDNGVILLVVKQDRKIRIEVGYGLEGVLPDSLAGEIIRDKMAPYFRRGKFIEGIRLAIFSIIEATRGWYRGDRAPPPMKAKGSTFSKFFLGLFLMFLIGTFGFLFLILVVVAIKHLPSPGYGSSIGGGFGGGFGGGGSFGGGGGFSGGGGGFGGGGASGGW
jgi:uncharacterized protein